MSGMAPDRAPAPEPGWVRPPPIPYATAGASARTRRIAIGVIALTVGLAAAASVGYGTWAMLHRDDITDNGWTVTRIVLEFVLQLFLPAFGLILLVRSRFAWHCATAYFAASLIHALVATVPVQLRLAGAPQGIFYALRFVPPALAGMVIDALLLALLLNPVIRALIADFARRADDALSPHAGPPLQSSP
jgi:hypothetical protein